MVKTSIESKYLLIHFITEYKFLIYSLNSSLDKLNQITLTRRPISSTYFLKLLKEIYNVDSNTIIGITGKYNEKGRFFSLLYGYTIANDIRIRKLDFYQACERVNFNFKIIKNANKITDWYKKYYILYEEVLDKKSVKFITSEFLAIIENRSKKEQLIFKKSLLLLMYIYIRETLYNTVKRSKEKSETFIKKEKTINTYTENKICIID